MIDSTSHVDCILLRSRAWPGHSPVTRLNAPGECRFEVVAQTAGQGGDCEAFVPQGGARHVHPPSDARRHVRCCPSHCWFVRTFKRLIGVTPHQNIRRARLREEAKRLCIERRRILDIALDCGFGDISNFNRAFRAEFGLTRRAHQQRAE